MKKAFILLSLLVCIHPCFTQDSLPQKCILDASVSLGALGGDWVTNSMGIQLGVDFRLKKNWSLQADIRYIFDLSRSNTLYKFHIDVIDLWGVALNSELKVYIQPEKEHLKGAYIGVRAIGMYTESSLDARDVYRSKTGLCAVAGWKYISRNGFLFEPSAGIGAQIISSHSSDITAVNDEEPKEYLWPKTYGSGSSFYPDFFINMRIGWRL